eukprot:Skav236668  [mRNA]  locus=scaffold338:219292:219789:- [translate_table: standard]
MSALQMDPAPEPKGGDHLPKVWVAGEGLGEVADSGVVDVIGKKQGEGDETEAVNEEDLVHAVSKFTPPVFFTRPCYKELDDKGLTGLPQATGFTLSYHTSSSQWHARWQDANKHFAPSHGAIRSELKSLLLSLCKLWEWYLSIEDSVEGRNHLKRLEEYMSKVEF